jgi:hypothetical protein
LKPDAIEGSDVEMPEFNVSYKPQKISPKSRLTVRHLLHQRIRDAYTHPQFTSDVMKPLLIEQLMDQEVLNLSGGELQRVALCLCLGKVFYISSLRTARDCLCILILVSSLSFLSLSALKRSQIYVDISWFSFHM